MSIIKRQDLPQGFEVELHHESDGRYCVRILAPQSSAREFAGFLSIFFTCGLTLPLLMMGRNVYKAVYFNSQRSAFGFYNKVVQQSKSNAVRLRA